MEEVGDTAEAGKMDKGGMLEIIVEEEDGARTMKVE